MALSKKEQEFMEWWERVRDRERKTFRQLIVGLPLGLIFATPILLSFFSSRFWYKRADMVGNSQFNPTILLVAVLAIAVFVAIFNKKLKWERCEETYQRLKLKAEDEHTDPAT